MNINRLETPEDIENYKQWLSSKSLARLRSIRLIYEKDLKTNGLIYPNLELRFKLLDNEYRKRVH